MRTWEKVKRSRIGRKGGGKEMELTGEDFSC